ncbi:hypothetical protein PHSC3_002023 [Chlamydiales bacterium STE3]|nr:hypothetical protein PHSC3_002023 [Chlamydiales bacterium STE3]
MANALFPLDPKCLKLEYRKEIRLAPRVIPIFDPLHGKKFLLNTRKSLKSNQDRVILSYAIPKGEMYEKNLIKVGAGVYPPVTKEEFSGGVVFWQEIPSPQREALPLYLQKSGDLRFVLNTYYTQEGFLRLAQECSFKIINTISVHDADNERNVVSLQPI